MKEVVATLKAPQAIGPYSQGIKIRCSNLVFCSGQVAIDPETKKVIGDTAAEQCRQVLKNMGEILKAAGAGYENIVKTTMYLSDMNDFKSVNEVYASFFDKQPPARATVQVSRLPLDAKVEIDAIAVI
ncbi:MAG TPA: RidA family protein [candidate division Zixibacteria bacterium]|nr:RidA family protein [candidate division Zixibacteria bacterium]